MTRTRLATVVAGAVAAVVVLALAAGPVSAAPVHLLPYRGLETWVDIYDVSLRADPEAAVAGMRAAGVHTLYFETSSSTAPAAIVAPSVVTRFIAAAHASRMKVVAWYRPELTRPGIHRYRSLQAIAFRTPDGQRFDAFALDIESAAVHNAGLRTRRLLDLSTALRSAAGGAYPLGAIVPAPAGMRLNPGYWPHFPFRALRSRFSVFLPMAHFTYHVTTATAAHDYTASNVALLRARMGDAAIPIHLVGGEAGAAPDDQVAAFVRAARERGVLGVSLYDDATTTPSQWAILADGPFNPRQLPALPLTLPGRAAVGDIPGGDRSHPKEVFYRTGRLEGTWAVRYQAFDLQPGEVELWVNWQPVAALDPTAAGAWATTRRLPIPPELLHAGRPNYIQLVSASTYPSWSTWGVRAVSLVQTARASRPGAGEADVVLGQ